AELAFLRHVFGAESAEEVGRVFVTHRVIAELLRARRARMEAVIAEGGLTDVFGRSYAIGDEIDGRRVTVRTCLAAEMQAAEAYVMLPLARVFLDEEAEARASGRRAEAEIALWQSDGLTLRLQRGERDADRWIGRAADALQDGCRALEAALGCPTVHTRLE